jgi:DNA-binding CsgD family transcriptional regulator/ArsR family metal-binding transcriptional regulator
MFLKGYTDLTLEEGGPPVGNGMSTGNGKFAHFRLKTDVSGLFPYINTMGRAAGFFPKLPFIRFVLDGFCCGLHASHGVSAAFADRQQAFDFMERLLAFLNEVSRRREHLEPNYRGWNPVPALQIFKLLPQTNCGVCGYSSCLAFAAALSRHKTDPERCPGFQRPLVTQAVYPVTDRQGKMVSTVTLDFDPGRFNYHPGPQQPGRPEAHRLRKAAPSQDGIIMPLTNREKEVLRLVAQGATNPEIAARLELSGHTVKSHIINIFNKLAVNDRTQAAVWAVRQRLV